LETVVLSALLLLSKKHQSTHAATLAALNLLL
jgi:hypothetical protein